MDDIKAKTDPLGSATVTVVSPLSTNGLAIELVIGDDYLVANGRQLDFTIAAGAPNLTGASVSLCVSDQLLVLPGTVTSAGAGAQTIRFQFTHTTVQFSLVGGQDYTYDIRAVLSDGATVTLLSSGVMTVVDSEAS